MAVWCEEFARQVLGLRFEPSCEVPFEASATLYALGSLDIASGFVSAVRGGRTRELTADGNDDLYLITVNGSGLVSQRGREMPVGDGDAFLIGAADPYTFASPGTARMCSLRVPRDVLAPLVPDIDDAIMRPLQRGRNALKLLNGYVGLLKQDDILANTELRRLAVTHVHDLLALVIGATRDATATAKGRGIRAVRLAAIKADIIENLAHAKLSVATVAAHHGVSQRYVQMLFEGEGTSFSQFVQRERLARAHQMLTNPVYDHLNIGTIAFDAGFGDLSHFNHAFRRRYGITPSDARAAAALLGRSDQAKIRAVGQIRGRR